MRAREKISNRCEICSVVAHSSLSFTFAFFLCSVLAEHSGFLGHAEENLSLREKGTLAFCWVTLLLLPALFLSSNLSCAVCLTSKSCLNCLNHLNCLCLCPLVLCLCLFCLSLDADLGCGMSWVANWSCMVATNHGRGDVQWLIALC